MSTSIFPEDWDELTANRISEREKRNRYWAMLRRLRDQFFKEFPSCSDDDFYNHLKQEYGFSARQQGEIGAAPTIIDEQKYMLFLLKYAT